MDTKLKGNVLQIGSKTIILPPLVPRYGAYYYDNGSKTIKYDSELELAYYMGTHSTFNMCKADKVLSLLHEIRDIIALSPPQEAKEEDHLWFKKWCSSLKI